ncbi:flavin reductase family protein [Catalinimonas niigatensis]|uniref:flavin reductase family protein n=1 Tax=Catalinimonas niigatensis TaxID=1397264 RepID=UPI002666F209|nr:flavin reductase [Catalinimonas niigatensis]WPP50671.1 flavin reductase [Catalinimonas niigatensis]
MISISQNDIKQYDKYYRTHLINSLTGFKSVSLIGSIDREGFTNLAIFSQIIHVGANPPLIGILFRPDTGARHTLENIMNVQHFTINHIPASHARHAHYTSARWKTSEFEACGFTPQFSELLKAPYVKESPVQLGCEFVERQQIQANGTILIIAEIKEIRVAEGTLLEDGFVDLEKAGSITCSGLDSYHTTNKIARYSYAKAGKEPEEL